MKQLRTESIACAASWVAAYVLTGFAFTSNLDGGWLLFAAPASWLVAIVLTLLLLDLKQRNLSWVFLAIVPFGWGFLLSLAPLVPGQPSARSGKSGAGRILTGAFLGVCGLIFLASACAGLYFSLRPSTYPNVTERVSAIPVFLCFLFIGLIWSRFAIRTARGLEG